MNRLSWRFLFLSLRGLLALGSYCLSYDEWRRDGQGGPQRSGFRLWLRRNLPLSGVHVYRSLFDPVNILYMLPMVMLMAVHHQDLILWGSNFYFQKKKKTTHPILLHLLSVVLAVWRLGRRRHWRSATREGRKAAVCPLGRRQRVLERPSGKGLR